ncbi:MAG: HAD-IC family P-type ATPase, partial [Hymenobacteraceae bacterium]|nr:HAD-IC family P-type ATPase [Hymenobacteraceae bacterium]
SFVSGEAEPVEKVVGEIIYAGGRQVGESIELEVVKEVSQGYLTQLWNNAVFEKNEKKSLGDYANKIAKYFVAVTLLVAIGGVIYWYPRDPEIAIKAFTSVLIIACPCALSLSTPFTLGNALRIFGKNKFYLKNINVVEALANADTVVFDKTGTLTEPSQSEVAFHGRTLTAAEKQMLRSLLKHSTHPLSLRIYNTLEGQALPVKGFEENTGSGIRGFVCDVDHRVGSASFTGAASAPGVTHNPLQTRVYIKIGDEIAGYYTFGNVYRNGINEVISELKQEKKLAVLSGDNDSERQRLQQIMGQEADLNFSQSPVNKLDYIKNLKEQQHGVIMVGDGLNDAGALKQSDAGIALTDNVSGFSPSCDAILYASKFDKLSLFIRFSKVSMKIIIASFIVSFFYNIIGLTLAVRGEFSPIVSAILMPISTLSVITFATVAVRVAAKQMGLSDYAKEEER